MVFYAIEFAYARGGQIYGLSLTPSSRF